MVGKVPCEATRQPSTLLRLTVEQGTSLAADWKLLLGTAFGTHSVGGKSKLHPQDVRQMLLYLAEAKKRTYPKRDLIAVHKTLRDVVEKESSYG